MLYDSLRDSTDTDLDDDRYIDEPWLGIVTNKHIFFEKRPADEVDARLDSVVNDLKQYCYGAKFHVLFDLLEFICKAHPRGMNIAASLNGAFKLGRAAYRMNEIGLHIDPVPTEEEGRAIQKALEALRAEEFAGARVHLRKAGSYLGQPGKEADSVRESIHAVEAVCKVLTGNPAATLGEALKILKQKLDLHGAFEGALGKLYGYTSDENGIRHSLTEEGAAVDAVDAQFMFGACASFVSYLVGKARTARIIE